MFRSRAILLIPFAIALAQPAAAKPPLKWGAVITDRDRTRLRDWRVTWISAVNKARAAGEGVRIDGEGPLLQPDAAQEGSPPPAGAYRCRLVKVGAQARAIPNFIVQDGLHCRIAGDMLTVTGGPQRPNGRLYRLDTARQLFLGAMTVGDEENIMPYRRDPDRNILGLLDRIGPQRWRLAMPQPRWQSMLEVLDLVPEAPDQSASAVKARRRSPNA
ncbi:DUF4893 domain-containing protein [Sphingomonas nostoxanthinifaciens]|uniref:DUF4893 domain-containing protein n=1 Tax=Sphingomonas nostoxanthinifaciens TaxID=2872652 RepID=UPI001CC212DE|nr:DUF4893 domain-containing protein [Sphingomonas nostoxanthinifaciens]UAK25429.1 DUF4893 domain-containing protein [Sphingomonas nostoxanthinifaciens]